MRQWRRQAMTQFGFMALAVALVLGMFLVQYKKSPQQGLISFITMLVILGPIMAWRAWSYRRGADGLSPLQKSVLKRFRRSIEGGKISVPQGEQVVTLTDAGIRVEVDGGVREHPWASVMDVREVNDRLVFFVSPSTGYSVPRTAFESAEAFEEFAGLIRSRASSVDGLTR
jgi:hypothetical protein